MTTLFFFLGVLSGLLAGVFLSRAALAKVQITRDRCIKDLVRATEYNNKSKKYNKEAFAFHKDASHKYEQALLMYREIKAIIPDLPGQRLKDKEWKH